ncbi:MAG: DUF1572 family protein [Bacteroidetes bacterium]|nr:DUF1572 family protein [Bacteroidota bacterium]MBS1930411.1 DUF1572 family protein [Bacteroidota bacterium]
MDGQIFLQSALKEFRDYKALADKTFKQLEEKDFHFQPNEECNSIAILIQHLHGNMLSRWINFLTEDGEKEWRQRDDEFEIHRYNKEQLLNLWEEGWQTVFNAIEPLQEGDLSKTIMIRTKPHSVVEAINRQLTHYASHVGQIILLGKILKGKNWQTLSVPRGQSKVYTDKMAKK